MTGKYLIILLYFLVLWLFRKELFQLPKSIVGKIIVIVINILFIYSFFWIFVDATFIMENYSLRREQFDFSCRSHPGVESDFPSL